MNEDLTCIFHALSSRQRCSSLVAQSGTLLYRRLATGRASKIPAVQTTRRTHRIAFCDTADCQSALQVRDAAADGDSGSADGSTTR